MLRKLFNGRRKAVTLAALVVLLGGVGAWIWAQVGPQTVPLRVKALDAEISSIKVPIAGEWKETGPIKVSLAGPGSQFPVGKLDVRNQRAVVVWPVSISAPLLRELGLGKIETFLVGVGRRQSPDKVDMTTSDFTVLRIPGLPSLVTANFNVWIFLSSPNADREDFWAGKPGTEATGGFGPFDEETFRNLDVRQLVKEGFSVASQFMHFPIEDTETFLDNIVKLAKERQHEIVVYIPEYNSYQTADLKGTATLRVER